MARRKPFKEPGDIFDAISFAFRDDHGLFLLSIPGNVIEKLGVRDGDAFIWRDYYRNRKKTIIRVELSRRS